jgi:RimJ/RimL family protein N-acetyltransferase
MTLASDRLDLVLQTPAEVLAWVAGLPEEVRMEISPVWLERVRGTAEGDPWALSYTVIERATGRTVGGCSFKGPPDGGGVVEIAYGIDEPHRGQGYATEAAGRLVRFAIESGAVTIVRAHTKIENGPSHRVLAKNGFVEVGDVIDPEDGLVRRWERDGGRNDSEAPR